MIAHQGGDRGIPRGAQSRDKPLARQIPSEAGADGDLRVGERRHQPTQPIRGGSSVDVREDQNFGGLIQRRESMQ